MQLPPSSGQTMLFVPLRCAQVVKLKRQSFWVSFTGSVSGDSMKEKLLTNYGETMKLKADTGNSYCECSGSGPFLF